MTARGNSRIVVLGVLLAGTVGAEPGQSNYESAPIRYRQTVPSDRIASLEAKLAAGSAALSHEPAHGYLKALLEKLDIPESSQGLVFSKTSFQQRRISPRYPRALYFNDDVYVGWVAGGDVVEISSVDPQLGAVFYTLSQEPEARPKFVRQTDACLQCHDSSGFTGGVPGHVVRSVYAGGDGMPHFNRGTFRTTYRSPYEERWGGWYVTGELGGLRHLGNAVYSEIPERDRRPRPGPVDLSSRIELEAYLAQTSDVVALMVLEHQTHVHNLLARANYETRIAELQSRDMNRVMGTPDAPLTEGARSRIRASCEPLVEALLLSGEPPLSNPVRGDSTFAAEFGNRGPFDRRGRSLRQLDLKRRLFKYSCSYLIYSKAFAGLPGAARALVSKRLCDILLGREAGPAFVHLSQEDREAIFQILRETLPELSEAWK